jgi:hypothetical protein
MSDANAAAGFSGDELRTLACVLDLLIPPSSDGRLPGAGEVGIGARIDQLAERDPGLRAVVAAGVAALDELAHSGGASGFAALAGEGRLAALQEVAKAQPGLVPSLIFHTYAGYYQQGRVLEGLGLDARPPFPIGHQLEPFDGALLDPVRRRAKLYRDV